MTSESGPRFAMYERVKLATDDPEKAEVDGKVGTIWWPGSQDKTGRWLYTVFICPDNGEWPCDGRMWDVQEDELQPTGEFGWQHTMAILYPPKYDFYEKVVVNTANPKYAGYSGQVAAIVGRGQGVDGRWNYAVHIHGHEDVPGFWENELFPTGEFDRELEEADKHREHIHVRVDEHGRGHIVESDE